GCKAGAAWSLPPLRRQFINPLHGGLWPALWKCRPQDKRPSEYIHATLDLAHDQAGVRIAFPAGVVGNEGLQRQVETIVLRKLRYSPDDVIAAPVFGGPHRYLRVIAKRRVPRRGEVDFADPAIREIVANA